MTLKGLLLWFSVGIAGVLATNLVCYYDSRAATLTTPVLPNALAATNCTHYVYVGATVFTPDDVRPLRTYDTAAGFASFRALRKDGVKLYVQLGTEYNNGNNLTTAIGSCSDVFVKNVALFLERYAFDGLDLDQRVPASKDSLKNCIIKLRARLYMHGKELAVSTTTNVDLYDTVVLSLYTDMINVHGYNFSTVSSKTALLAPLFSDGLSPVSVSSSLASWYVNSAGNVRRSKVNLVVATFGRSYELTSAGQSAVGAGTVGPAAAGSNTNRPGYLATYEICPAANSYTVVDNSATYGSYFLKGTRWITAETENTLVQKFTYTLDNRLAGVGLYTLDADDITNACRGGAYLAASLAYQYLLQD